MSSTVVRSGGSSKISFGLSLLYMGLGQLYNRQFIKGLLYIALETYVIIFWSKPFSHAMWGLFTLGERVQERNARGAVTYAGDHSIMLMIEGIIFALIFILFIIVYILNIRDAYKNGQIRERGEKVRNFGGVIIPCVGKRLCLFPACPFRIVCDLCHCIAACFRCSDCLYELLRPASFAAEAIG